MLHHEELRHLYRSLSTVLRLKPGLRRAENVTEMGKVRNEYGILVGGGETCWKTSICKLDQEMRVWL